jgi:hypothetical protein
MDNTDQHTVCRVRGFHCTKDSDFGPLGRITMLSSRSIQKIRRIILLPPSGFKLTYEPRFSVNPAKHYNALNSALTLLTCIREVLSCNLV